MSRKSLENLWHELKLGAEDMMSIDQYSQMLSVLCPSAVWNNQEKLDQNEFIQSLQTVLEALHPFMTVEDRTTWLVTHYRVDSNGKLNVMSENIPSKQPATVRTTNLAQLQASGDAQVLKAKQRQKIASINQLANPRELVRKLDQSEALIDNCSLRAIGSKAYDKDMIQSNQDQLEKKLKLRRNIEYKPASPSSGNSDPLEAMTVTHIATDQSQVAQVSLASPAKSSLVPKPQEEQRLLCTICKENEAKLWCSPCFAIFCQKCWSNIHGTDMICEPIEKEIDQLDLEQSYTSYIRARAMSPLELTTERITARLRRAMTPQLNPGKVVLGKPVRVKKEVVPEQDKTALQLVAHPLDIAQTVDVKEIEDYFPNRIQKV